MKAKTAEEILNSKNITPITRFHEYSYLYKSIIDAMEEYAEQETLMISLLYSKPERVLIPLEDMYRKEHPRPDGKFYLPDKTIFYKWIISKIIKDD